MFSKKLAALVAASLVTTSSPAMAQSAQSLSLSKSPAAARVATDARKASKLESRNGIGIYIVGAVVLGLIIWGVIELTKDDSPHSP